MAEFDNDEVPILSDANPKQSNESDGSKFQNLVPRTQSVSISIPMIPMEPYERDTNFKGHTGPLRSQRNASFNPMSGPLYVTHTPGNLFGQNMVAPRNNAGKNEHLLRSGQLGMCNDPYCTTCPTYFKATQQSDLKSSGLFNPKLQNVVYGDAKDWARRFFAFLIPHVPRIMNPHHKFVQQWNKLFAICCLVAIFVDPLFFFLLSVDKDHKCIVRNSTMTTVLVFLRSVNDYIHFLNIILQFRLAYVVCPGELADHPKKIALHYLQTYFLFDLFVVLPLPQIMILISLGSSVAHYTKNLLPLVIFVQYIPKLLRFLTQLIGQSPTQFIFASGEANLTIGLLTFMFSGHVVGSCWYLFGLQRVNQCLRDACHRSNLPGCMDLIDFRSKESNISARWINDVGANACLNSTSGAFSYGIYANAIPLTIETNVFDKHLYALFWGFQQIITLAGNQTPSYFVWEVLFAISIMALGLILLALLIGNIQGFFQSLGKRRVRQAERYSWAATRGVSEKMVLENLPEDLQTHIRRHIFKFVKKVPIFSLMDENEPILDAILERLIHTTYNRGSRILRQGCLIQKVVFIVRGKLESVGEDGIPVTLTEGDACGEEVLRWYLERSSKSKEGKKVKLQGWGLTSTRSVRCLNNVEAFSLRVKDIEELATLFAGFLRSPHSQGVIRYESPCGKSQRANKIQIAWTNKKKRVRRANTAQ